MCHHLILVRHGESAHLVNATTGGWSENPLTSRGKTQAKSTGQALAAKLRYDTVGFYASDLPRAKQTAEIIGSAINIAPVLCPALRELNNGVARNKPLAEAERLLLPMTEPLIDWVPYPEAESWGMMARRVMMWMEQRVRGVQSDTMLIVLHSHAMVAMVHWWLGLQEPYFSRVSYIFDCCSITELTMNRWGERTIARLNDTAHLQGV
jgi:probable phosphoglycerate mutase